MAILGGSIVRLRPRCARRPARAHGDSADAEVFARWRGGADLRAAVEEDFNEPGSTPYVIELDGRVVGWIQWSAEDEPDYRHATIDIYLDPAVHRRGVGTDLLAEELTD